MQHTPTATLGSTFDGAIDPALEQPMATAGDGADAPSVGSEAAAHALLRLIGEHPGQMGRLRAARIIGGFTVPYRDADDARELAPYAIRLDWTLREITRLVDALINGRLVAQTPGPRPVLVLTRAGFRALEALEGMHGERLGPTPVSGTT